MNLICTNISPEEIRGNPMWIVNLSDGTVAYQSDYNSSLKYSNSWLGLKEHIEQNHLSIKDMVLRFRDHTEFVGSGARGYFFVKEILGNIYGYNQEFFKTGTLEGNKIVGNKWIIPELITFPGEETFIKELNEWNLQSLIRNN